MPKLIIFAPCERVIVSREGPISLITMLEGVNVSLTPEEHANLPDDALAPMIWHILTKWLREKDEEPQQWEQRLQVLRPDGRTSVDLITAFDLVANPAMRNIAGINGFPIKPLGECTITLSLRRAGEDDGAWQEIATYPIPVEDAQPTPEQ